ncbi:MAG: ChbG/HpnK family deacetylase [Actinomycetota bacterium]
MSPLTEALGHDPDARLLILSADLLGSTHAATAAGLTALREGCATTGTLMMPGPWARHAADRIVGDPTLDIGIHLTLNAELEDFRWAPLTHAPSLLDGDGGFPRTPADLWDHADIDEVRRECRAQVERARSWGVQPTHLTTHLSALQQRPEFFDVLLDIACDTELPVRLESASAEGDAGFPFRRLAAEEGVLMPDHFRLVRGGARSHLDQVLADLPSGVTEVAFAPALAAEEIRAIDPGAAGRFDDLAVLTDRTLEERLDRLGVVRTGYAALRDAQRARR